LSSRTSRWKKWVSHGFGRDLVLRQPTFAWSHDSEPAFGETLYAELHHVMGRPR
jgi:hypothetical protein